MYTLNVMPAFNLSLIRNSASWVLHQLSYPEYDWRINKLCFARCALRSIRVCYNYLGWKAYQSRTLESGNVPMWFIKKYRDIFEKNRFFEILMIGKIRYLKNRRNFLSGIKKIHMKKSLTQAIQNCDLERGLYCLNRDKSNVVNYGYQKTPIFENWRVFALDFLLCVRNTRAV